MNGKLDHSQVWRASMKLMAATVFAVISVSAWGDRQAKASGAAPDVLASLSLAIGNYVTSAKVRVIFFRREIHKGHELCESLR